MFITNFCTSHNALFGDMAFQDDGLFVYHRVEVGFVGDPMLEGTVVARSIGIYIGFFSGHVVIV